MASLYRKPVLITDRATGEKVKSKSKKWWGQYKDAEGRLKRVPLAVDKTAARAMLDKLVRQVEREKAGLTSQVLPRSLVNSKCTRRLRQDTQRIEPSSS